MEYKIGETFSHKGKTFKVVKSETCKNCAFHSTYNCRTDRKLKDDYLVCNFQNRMDGQNVIFQEVLDENENKVIIDNVTYVAVEVKEDDDNCLQCAFKRLIKDCKGDKVGDYNCIRDCIKTKEVFYCTKKYRKDRKNVIYVIEEE